MKVNFIKLFLVFSIILPATLISCSSQKSLNEKSMKIGDNIISLYDEAKDDYSNILGKHINTFETESCYYDGNDKEDVYEFGTILSSVNEKGNIINGIVITSKDATIISNIKIGDHIDTVKKAYTQSPDTEEENILTYTINKDVGITFFTSNETVTKIELFATKAI